MKLLQLDVTFILPDGFDGDAEDALRELAKYLRTAPTPDPDQDMGPNAGEGDTLTEELCAIRYERVPVAVERGHRMIGNGNLVSDESGEWEQVGDDLRTLQPCPKFWDDDPEVEDDSAPG